MTCIDSTTTADRLEPDLVLTDLGQPLTGTGLAPSAPSRPGPAAVGVVVLSQHPGSSYGFDVDELLAAITEATRGGAAEAPAVGVRRRGSELDRLTRRERQILAEMARGKNNAAIAASLFLSQRAVEKHINSIFSKLGLTEEPNVNRRVKAVLLHLEAARETSHP